MPRNLRAVVCLVAMFAAPAGLSGRQAGASELPPVAGVGYPNVPIDRGKKLSAFFGYSYGQDSNILRAESGSLDEKEDYFQEGLIGLVFVTGVPTRSFDIRYEGKLEYFQEQTDLDYMEHVVKGSIVRQTEASSVIVRGSFEQLARSTEIEADGLLAGELLARERTFVAPDLAFRKGQLEMSLGYSLGQNTYPDWSQGDFEDKSYNGELRLWRGETTNYFLHFDMGTVTYEGTVNEDYGYQRIYLGLRSERTARSGYEIALGVQGNDKEFAPFDPLDEEVFASVRSTWLLLNSRAALVLGYTQGAEASLISDFKSVQRLTARLSYAANSRLSFTVGGTQESAEFGNYYEVTDPAPDDMSRLAWDAGIIYEIGSPERLHGRLFVSYGAGSRDGETATDDYARTRWFGGLALVY